MLNIFSLICICLSLNSAIYSSIFFFIKLPKAYTFLNPIIDVMPITLFFISLCLASDCKFSMRSLILP